MLGQMEQLQVYILTIQRIYLRMLEHEHFVAHFPHADVVHGVCLECALFDRRLYYCCLYPLFSFVDSLQVNHSPPVSSVLDA